ncbi:META domain-containing protein [Arthrobacter sp. Sa2CUA1]|uniref:META domain-containing protein n=1 Tax=Arthrobacter gallicola TaxID=2762225 RepID=A0ABR8UQ25_9MICC|nr:META domain-containing protein [Arthrobacter gallicola]MBD7994673.1 META domain-containing protein [Arthrobacter gallicola]
MRPRYLILALALTLGVSACATDAGSGSAGSDSPSSKPSAEAPATSAAEVEGTWGNPDEMREPSLNLGSDGRISGTDGCNRLLGSWTFEDGKVHFSEMGMTMMACPDVDQWLSKASTAVPETDTLRIYDAGGTEIGTLTR